MLRKLIVATAMACLVAPVFASDWQEIYAAKDRTVYVDATSYSAEGQIAHAWIRQDFKGDQVATNGQVYDTRQDRVEINCANWKVSTSTSIGMYHGQESVKFQTSSFQDIIPDTYTSKVAELICRKS